MSVALIVTNAIKPPRGDIRSTNVAPRGLSYVRPGKMLLLGL